MKKILILLAILPFLISCQNSNAQTKLIGKTYIAYIGQTCKDGIGTLSKYRILEFKKNSVIVSYQVIENVIPEKKGSYEHMYDNLKKTYKYNLNDSVLTFKNCEELDKMKVFESKLISLNGEIIFKEQNK